MLCTESEADLMAADSNILDFTSGQCDVRSKELIQEFKKHYMEYMNEYPEHAGKRQEIFEGWAIQKIAGLQLCVDYIVNHINRQG